jgi:hypothetical protein
MRALIHAFVAIATLPMTALAADSDDCSRAGAAPADTAVREMGEHPAVLVFRNWGKRGYDYASKFYLHPARLALESVPPREMGEHPAVVVAKTWSERGAGVATQIAAHLALLPRAKAASPAAPGIAFDRPAGIVPIAAVKRGADSESQR